MVIEKWKPINGNLNYSVSDSGNVKNLKTGRILSASLTSNGYLKVRLFNEGIGKTFTIHSLVAEAFLSIGGGLVVNHINYDKTDNRLSNLEKITQRQNAKHSRQNKLYSSCYIGVSWFKRNKKWGATIFVDGKNKFLGLFKNEIDAKKSYDGHLLTLN